MLFQCDVHLGRDWRKQNLPKPIRQFMKRWEKTAKKAMKTYVFQWPAKYVQTQFVYEGKSYSITPGTFDIPADLCEIFQTNGMDDDLRAIPGVQEVQSCGFID